MPKILDRLVSQLKAKGMSESKAFATATSVLQKMRIIKIWDTEINTNWTKKTVSWLTPTGQKRQSLGAAGRAKDRAAQKAGGKSSEYKYNQLTNRARLKKKS
jgi:hypothetical protein